MIRTPLMLAQDWLLRAPRATYGVAAIRIIVGLTMIGFLLANWRNRHYLWGDAAQWASPLDDNGGFGWPFTFFAGGSGQEELTVKLLAVLGLAAAFTVGWRGRLMTPLLLVCWVSLIESNPLYGNQSDNIVRILLIYLCFADVSARWSWDARRRARGRGLGHRVVPEPVRREAARLGTLLHNLAVVAIGAQICLVYVVSGFYKMQGETWQEGTAVYYPLQMGQYRPWPALADTLSSNALGVLAATYFSVVIQLFFPLLLLRRFTRVVAIMGVLVMHAGIAVIMGLPFFSLFMMAGDQIFVRDTTYTAIAGRAKRQWRRWTRRHLRGHRPENPDEAATGATDPGSEVPAEPAGAAGPTL